MRQRCCALGGVLSSVQVAFALYACSFAVGAALVMCFRLETSRMPLMDAI